MGSTKSTVLPGFFVKYIPDTSDLAKLERQRKVYCNTPKAPQKSTPTINLEVISIATAMRDA